MWGWRSSRTIAVGAAGAAFVLFCVLPFVFMLVQWFKRLGTLAIVRGLEPRRVNRACCRATAVLGAGHGVAVNGSWRAHGVALGRSEACRLRERCGFFLPRRPCYRRTSLGSPWLSLGDSTWMRTLPAGAIVLTVVLYPLSMLMTEAALRASSRDSEEAASLVASQGEFCGT